MLEVEIAVLEPVELLQNHTERERDAKTLLMLWPKKQKNWQQPRRPRLLSRCLPLQTSNLLPGSWVNLTTKTTGYNWLRHLSKNYSKFERILQESGHYFEPPQFVNCLGRHCLQYSCSCWKLCLNFLPIVLIRNFRFDFRRSCKLCTTGTDLLRDRTRTEIHVKNNG